MCIPFSVFDLLPEFIMTRLLEGSFVFIWLCFFGIFCLFGGLLGFVLFFFNSPKFYSHCSRVSFQAMPSNMISVTDKPYLFVSIMFP